MKPQYQHSVTTAFMLWFDHHLLEKGAAFSDKTATLFNYADPTLPSDKKVFGSKYKQWVNDSSITGATVPVAVTVNTVPKGRADGIVFDFQNGRVFSPSLVATDTVVASFSVKDFNIYTSNEDEEDIIFENKKLENPRYGPFLGSYIPPYDIVIPAVFIANEASKNEPFAFGGMDSTLSIIKCVVLAEDEYQLDGILSLFADTKKMVVPFIEFEDSPVTEYGDVKSGSYNYDTLAALQAPEDALFINDVTTAKLKDANKRGANPNAFVGFIDFEVVKYRYPRSS